MLKCFEDLHKATVTQTLNLKGCNFYLEGKRPLFSVCVTLFIFTVSSWVVGDYLHSSQYLTYETPICGNLLKTKAIKTSFFVHFFPTNFISPRPATTHQLGGDYRTGAYQGFVNWSLGLYEWGLTLYTVKMSQSGPMHLVSALYSTVLCIAQLFEWC